MSWWAEMRHSLVILILSLCLGGCGYRLPNAAVTPELSGKTVRIALFGNRTFKPNIEGILTNKLIDEFSLHSGTFVVSGDSDFIITGEILSYGASAASYSAADIVREYRATMTVEAVLRRKETQQIIWKGSVSETQIYPANTNVAFQQNSEEAALRELARAVAQKLYHHIAQGF